MKRPGRLIGVGGRLTAGKDEVADYLVREHGWVKVFMSDPLNEALIKLDPVIPDFWSVGTSNRYTEILDKVGYTEAKTNPEVRRLLQVLGTEVGRQMFGEDVWVNIAGKKISQLRAAGENVVITGIRFPNELHMIRYQHGQSVWVSRPSVEKNKPLHISEIGVRDIEFMQTIINDGTLEDLYAKAAKLV